MIAGSNRHYRMQRLQRAIALVLAEHTDLETSVLPTLLRLAREIAAPAGGSASEGTSLHGRSHCTLQPVPRSMQG